MRLKFSPLNGLLVYGGGHDWDTPGCPDTVNIIRIEQFKSLKG